MISQFEEPIYVTRPTLPNTDRVVDSIKEIWRSKRLTNNGPKCRELECRLQARLGVKYLSAFNNGTTALMVACRALNLTGEVITTPFTFAATPHALTWNNLTPVFCDIDPITLNIDANKIEPLITERTSAILAVHVFGTPCDVEKIQSIADKYNLKVIYDAAHAFGITLNGGGGIGGLGDVSMMSFHATKIYHTIEGGALMCRDARLKERIDLFRNFGIAGEEEVELPGLNGKMNELQAAIGLIMLDCIDDEREKRAALEKIYDEELRHCEGIIRVPEFLLSSKSNHQYYVIRIDREKFGRSRDEVYDTLRRYNVFARKYFYPLCSDYDHYKNLPSAAPERLPNAHRISEEVLSMPLYGELSVEDVKKICAIVREGD